MFFGFGFVSFDGVICNTMLNNSKMVMLEQNVLNIPSNCDNIVNHCPYIYLQ